MKKHLVLGVTLAVIATPAFATKARLVALGEEITGSQYINDSRNIFLNAATANDYKDMAIFELGDDGKTGNNVGTGLGAKGDNDHTPQAEGGVLYGHGSMVYGAYFGGESSQTHEARQYLSLNDRVVHQDNQLDLFVAGDSGVKWGANLTYSKNKSDTVEPEAGGTDFEDIDSQTLTVRGGVIMGAIEGFANVAVMNKFEGNLNAGGQEEEFTGKLGFEVGGTYNMGAGKVFAFWRHAKWEQESDVAASATTSAGPAYSGEADGATDRYIVGYGREEKVSDKATMFYKVAVRMNKRKLETKDDGDAQLDDTVVPLTVGLEYDVESWLTLRGSISQNIYGQADYDYDDSLITAGVNPGVTGQYAQGKRTIKNSTVVNTGATVKFGDFSIDGLIGTSGNDGVNDALANGQGDKKGVLALDRLMSRVAMTYKF